MQSRKRLYGRIRDGLGDMKRDSVIDYMRRPNFTVSGNRELFAEGKIGVEVYGDEIIEFTASDMRVTVTGRGLTMCFYNRNTMKITGFITGIGFDSMRG